MFYELFFLAMLAGVVVALAAGPLGCFLVWRRMAYFGDTLSHSALLGVALALFWQLNTSIAVLAVCLLLALGMVFMQSQRQLADDTLLGIMAHSSLALGMIVVSLLPGVNIDLMSYLFGDILAITWADFLTVAFVSVLLLLLLTLYWKPLLAITVDEDLALVEGASLFKTRLLLMLMVALMIAMAMKIVGILLITSLLIIPAATSRRFSRSPEQMAVAAACLGAAAVIMGLLSSLVWDIPSGPAIVVTELLLFLCIYLWPSSLAQR